jgi:glycine cleavage system H protein
VIEQDDVFGTVEAVKTTSDLFMPITGKILEFNPSLDESEGDDPALINSDPYTEGWVIKIAIEDDAGIENLMTAEAYVDLIG